MQDEVVVRKGVKTFNFLPKTRKLKTSLSLSRQTKEFFSIHFTVIEERKQCTQSYTFMLQRRAKARPRGVPEDVWMNCISFEIPMTMKPTARARPGGVPEDERRCIYLPWDAE
jgi:hypothetical protein